MRLINCSTLQLEEFFGANIPDYVILSHRWEDEEVSFADFTRDQAAAQAKRGFRKIDLTCREAIEDGWQYAWVDTCCIDKSSSAELSEAINSMFNWYESSKACYVYLSDVRQAEIDVQFPRSMWFTRGWTLQELLAPENVWFFDQDWEYLGTKKEYADCISRITGIDESVLARSKRRVNAHDKEEYDVTIGSFCVAKRMSWASRRKTTREEDTAYALLGIFDINMPLLYGEGMRAFTRLQEEILNKYSDNSILAWGLDTISRQPDGNIPDAVTTGVLQAAGNNLAPSPEDFKHCQGLDYVAPTTSAPAMTSIGLQLEIPLVPFQNTLSNTSGLLIGILSCSTTPDTVVGILLRGAGPPFSKGHKVERQRFFNCDTQQWHSAVLLSPRAVTWSILELVVIGETPKTSIKAGNSLIRRIQVCINGSAALNDTGYLCSQGTVMKTDQNKADVECEWHWDSASRVLSLDSATGYLPYLSFHFQFSRGPFDPYRRFNHRGFTLYTYPGAREFRVLRDKLHQKYLHDNWKEYNRSKEDIPRSPVFYGADSRPFELRVTFEENNIFQWCIYKINVDVEFLNALNQRRKANGRTR
jgi:hypothetical protein